MEFQQSVMLSNSNVVTDPMKLKLDSVLQNSGNLFHRKETVVDNSEEFIGILQVYIHQARDIQNICIYHKQDVYAKFCLTSDPEKAFSTQIINGGGKNPVFNENRQFNVRTIDSSLKCEIWMLSRVRNYLEDQLLGFALVPLSDVIIGNGKLEQEFPLSSTDLFHSPAGFVQLSLSYNGASPEVLEIPTPCSSLAANADGKDSEIPASLTCEFVKIEFPDPKIVNENQMMVSEYLGIPCSEFDSQSPESLSSAENDPHFNSDSDVPIVESFSKVNLDSIEVSKVESPPSSVSTNGSPSVAVPASSQSLSDTPGAAKSPNQDLASPTKEKIDDVRESENGSSVVPGNACEPVVTVNVEAEQKVMQQEIVDMYLKSMQQFTESLAKLNLPMDTENESTSAGNLQASKGNGSRVFYGSRAFF